MKMRGYLWVWASLLLWGAVSNATVCLPWVAWLEGGDYLFKSTRGQFDHNNHVAAPHYLDWVISAVQEATHKCERDGVCSTPMMLTRTLVHFKESIQGIVKINVRLQAPELAGKLRKLKIKFSIFSEDYRVLHADGHLEFEFLGKTVDLKHVPPTPLTAINSEFGIPRVYSSFFMPGNSRLGPGHELHLWAALAKMIDGRWDKVIDGQRVSPEYFASHDIAFYMKSVDIEWFRPAKGNNEANVRSWVSKMIKDDSTLIMPFEIAPMGLPQTELDSCLYAKGKASIVVLDTSKRHPETGYFMRTSLPLHMHKFFFRPPVVVATEDVIVPQESFVVNDPRYLIPPPREPSREERP